MVAYTEEDILSALDDAQDNITWPDFEHLNYDILAVRLAAYRDDERWAIVFSTIQWNPASHDLFEVIAEPLGNCIEIPEGDELTVRLFDVVQVEIDPDDPALEERGSISEVRIRGKKIDLDKLELPEPEAGRDETFWLSVAIVDKYRNHLPPTDKELARFFPDGMPPKFLELGEWHHAKWGVASEWEVFQLLAKAMVEGDADIYRPTEKPNMHWRNWMNK
jgi:Family of unknown function (DUF7003)